VSHVDKLLLTVPELSVVSGCSKSNTSGVTRGQGTCYSCYSTLFTCHTSRVIPVTPTNNECSGTVSSTLSTCHTRRVTHVTVPCPRVTPDVLLMSQYLVHVSYQTCYSCYNALSTYHTRCVTLATVPCPCVTPDVLLLLHPLTTECSGTVSSTLFTCHTRRVTLSTPTNNREFRNGKQYLVHV
jgi:hypothetical protein